VRRWNIAARTETATLGLIDEKIRANTAAVLAEARRTGALPRAAATLARCRAAAPGDADAALGGQAGMNCAGSMSRRAFASTMPGG
jgi:hypothetical protein